MPRFRAALLAALALGLVGCDLLGIETASQVAARRESEGKAIGGACRHAGRSIEACYEQNRRADKAAVFAGWREMNDYMRENQIEPMPALSSTRVASADGTGPGTDDPAAEASRDPAGSSEPRPSTRAARAAAPK